MKDVEMDFEMFAMTGGTELAFMVYTTKLQIAERVCCLLVLNSVTSTQ